MFLVVIPAKAGILLFYIYSLSLVVYCIYRLERIIYLDFHF